MRKILPAFFIAASLLFLISPAFSPDPPVRECGLRAGDRAHESPLEALDALQFLSAAYGYPGADVPADGFGKAYDFYRQNFSNNAQKLIPPGSWQNIGPTNVGGRTLCIAVDPADTSTVWLGSAGGGLWKSTKGGMGSNAWTYVPTGFPVLGVGTIALRPGNSQTMLIGTGETYAYGISTNGLIDRTTRGTFGIGILKTTDGGTTWSQTLNWTYQQNRGVWDIKFNPLKPDEVYAATTEGIYKSADGGSTWSQVLSVQMAMNLVIDPVDTNIIYCGVGDLSSPNKGIYRSINSGSSWSILTNGLPSNANRTGRIVLAINPKNHKTVLAHVCNVFNTQKFYVSFDQGATWASRSPQDIASYQGWYAKGLLFNPADTSRILAGGVNVHISTDGANNFSQLSGPHSDIHDIAVNPKDPQKIYVATDGGLFRSNDFGNNFYECTDGYVTTQFYIGAISSTNANIAIAGAQDNWTWEYSGSPAWNGVIGGDGCYTAIDPGNDNNQFGAYQYLNVYKSTDGGANFSHVINSPSSSLGGNPTAFLAPYLLCPSNPQVMYAGGDSITKSTNGGSNWSAIGPKPLDNGNIILSIGVSAKNKDTVYVGTAPTQTTAHIFRSANGGTSFTDITGSLPNRYPRRITVDPKNSRIVYVIYSGFGTGHIFRSANAGASWTDISASLPDIPFHCLAVDPSNSNTLFAGCDLGVFYSADAGAAWASFNQGFPDAVMAFDLVVSPSDKSLLAFTHGHGVYKRSVSDAAVGVFAGGNTAPALSLYPNPAPDFLNVQFTVAVEGTGRVEVYDLNGKAWMIRSERLLAGKNTIRMDVGSIPEGAYLVRVVSNGGISCRRFIVAR